MTEDDGTGPHLGTNSLNDDDGYEPTGEQNSRPVQEETTEHGASSAGSRVPAVSKSEASDKSEKWPRRSWGQRAILLLNVATIFVSLVSVVLLSYSHIRASSINRVALDSQLAVPVGEPGNRVLNILLVGSDSAANLDSDDPIRKNRDGERLGDVIIIAHLDERTGQVALLSLPRDLWLPIGGSTASGRVNTTFASGGPATLIKTIEENFAIPIHHYLNVDFAGFKGVVEAVDSVDVYFDTPARDWNVAANPPRSQTGFEVRRSGCVALEPDQALAYVRSRYYQTKDEDGGWTTDPSSDLGRIQRQQDFLGRLLARAIEMGARNPIVLRDLIDAGLDNVTIDQELTPQTLLDLGRTFNGFEPSELQMYQLPVEGVRTADGDVLIPIESQLDPVLRLFAGNRFDEPSTMAVTITADEEEDEMMGAILESDLDDTGFEVTSNLRDDLPVRSTRDDVSAKPTSIVISHGRSDSAVATRLLASLDEEVSSVVTVVEDSQLPARRVRVRLVRAQDQPDGELQSEEGTTTPQTSQGSASEVEQSEDDGSSRKQEEATC